MQLWMIRATWLCDEATLTHISNRFDSASHLSKMQPHFNTQLAQSQNKVLSKRIVGAQQLYLEKRTISHLIMVAHLVVDGKSKCQHNDHHEGNPVSDLALVGLPLVLEVGPEPAASIAMVRVC